MTGVIKMFNEHRGFGFIYTDNEDVFFHIRNFKTQGVIPEVGMDVHFDVVKNEKGNQAINLEVCVDAKKTKFIKFGNNRIKASNIKSYGIYNHSEHYLCSIRSKIESLDRTIAQGEVFHNLYGREKKAAEEEKERLRNDKVYALAKDNKLMCLVISTYQNDCYEYYQYNCGFDIYKKMDELDEILC